MTAKREVGCPFCRKLRSPRDDDVVWLGDDCYAFPPLHPVTHNHFLVIPGAHVTDALDEPDLTGRVYTRAAAMARYMNLYPCNLITSAGELATQTVKHFHVHVVPRRHNDGLRLPWTL